MIELNTIKSRINAVIDRISALIGRISTAMLAFPPLKRWTAMVIKIIRIYE
ncbi:hypothetical protein KSZ_12180 [Dictyobacter formicarum]|uniref:Transposase DDE domain-containing protein n=1 Tax=Dictyobacter formicarum TaxID=2778368 RepID=A0ABQ3VBD9_9CHLR|nr:hypothetical protein KSZ_12180 [Dictyobacter formicarum]